MPLKYRLPLSEIESKSAAERKEYFELLCREYERVKHRYYGKFPIRIFTLLAPLQRKFDYEISGAENIPADTAAIFVGNHSNSHDLFTVLELSHQISVPITALVAADDLNAVQSLIFKCSDYTFIDRRDRDSAFMGILELTAQLREGKSCFIFPESTWNLHPVRPMQPIKVGPVEIASISQRPIIPVIFEYIEVPHICNKESELYEKCVICIGEPFYVDHERGIVEQTTELQTRMETMRREIWEKYGIKRRSIEEIDQDIYLNHTYLKKFKAFGYTYDSADEAQFIRPVNGRVENEYCLDSNGEFCPGITEKIR